MERNSCDIIEGTVPGFNLRDWTNHKETSFRIAVSHVENKMLWETKIRIHRIQIWNVVVKSKCEKSHRMTRSTTNEVYIVLTVHFWEYSSTKYRQRKTKVLNINDTEDCQSSWIRQIAYMKANRIPLLELEFKVSGRPKKRFRVKNRQLSLSWAALDDGTTEDGSYRVPKNIYVDSERRVWSSSKGKGGASERPQYEDDAVHVMTEQYCMPFLRKFNWNF
jgi:hypothetical protein